MGVGSRAERANGFRAGGKCLQSFWQCFVPLFVAVDAIGVLPMFVALTEGFDMERARLVVLQSVATALLVILAFLAFGPVILRYLGVTPEDFMIAGGALLFAISLSDLLTGQKKLRRVDPESVGAVPIGVPLIAGPATLTTCLLLADMHGKLATGTAAAANVLIAGAVFAFSQPLTRLLGRLASKTLSKIASLLLAAIAVMLMRQGIVGLMEISR